MKHIAVLGFERCEATGITAPIDIFGLANTLWERQSGQPGARIFAWKVLSPDGAPIRTSSGLHLAAEGRWADARGSDLVLLSAAHYSRLSELIRQLERLRSELGLLTALHRAGAMIAAGCTGTFLLGESGLLDGRAATTSWWLKDVFRERYPRAKLCADQLVTAADGVFCAGASSARVDLTLHLIEKFAGRTLALSSAKLLLVDANRLSQSVYFSLQDHVGHSDALVSRSQTWMQANLEHEFGLHALARHVGVSTRTLIRRFKQATGETPSGYAQALRVDAAKQLLESTGLSLEKVVVRVGYQDASTFRKLFRRHTGLSPREYRERFGIGRD